MKKIFFPLLATLLVLSACAAPAIVNPGESPEFTPMPFVDGPIQSPSATIEWFPATSTWTPFPTAESSATPQYSPGMGPLIYQDDFSNVFNWSLAKTESSGDKSIIVDRNRLTLAVNAPPAILYSINNDLALTNFYAEITLSVNRCFGQDSYGILFRTASGMYTYRYLLNCTGKVRVEQVRDNGTFALVDWVLSGDAPSGAPGMVKLGVWAAGTEMRFFLNGRYQFSLFDPLYKNGSLGVFVNASSPDGMNISFADLRIHSIDYVSPTPSSTPTKTPTPSRTPRPIP